MFVIIETGGETAFGIIVHFVGTDLKLDNFFIWSDDGGMKRLITVLFWNGNIIFNSTREWGIKRVYEAEDEITGSNIFNDNTQGG